MNTTHLAKKTRELNEYQKIREEYKVFLRDVIKIRCELTNAVIECDKINEFLNSNNNSFLKQTIQSKTTSLYDDINSNYNFLYEEITPHINSKIAELDKLIKQTEEDIKLIKQTLLKQ